MEKIKEYGIVTRNNGAIQTKGKDRKEAFEKIKKSYKEAKIEDVYMKTGDNWDNVTFDCK